ncbi:MAG: 2-phosphosulfolactate phosphatase [Bacteroidia bacterium]
MPKIETLLSPALFHLHSEGIEDKQVVIIDILRATTTVVVAFENGVDHVVASASVKETQTFRDKGYLVAAERNGITVEGFDLGNSPQDYTPELVNGRNIALTTTNGTRALNMAEEAETVWVASFRNLTATADALTQNGRDVLLFCAGWKDRFNMEDTLFAGALAEQLMSRGWSTEDDATLAAMDLYTRNQSQLPDFLEQASHVQRFKTLHLESDLEVCLKTDSSRIVVKLDGDKLVGQTM